MHLSCWSTGEIYTNAIQFAQSRILSHSWTVCLRMPSSQPATRRNIQSWRLQLLRTIWTGTMCPLLWRAGAAESMDHPRYLTALQHEGCHCRRLPAVIQCKGSGICLPLCVCHMMHADSRACIYCAVTQNAQGSNGCWRLSQLWIMSRALKNICCQQQFWHRDTYNQPSWSKRWFTCFSKCQMLHASCIAGVSGSIQGCGLYQVPWEVFQV